MLVFDKVIKTLITQKSLAAVLSPFLKCSGWLMQWSICILQV